LFNYVLEALLGRYVESGIEQAGPGVVTRQDFSSAIMVLVVGGCRWGPWCPAPGIIISGLRCLSVASCEAARGVLGNKLSGAWFWQSAGAPATMNFSAEPTAADIRLTPMLPLPQHTR